MAETKWCEPYKIDRSKKTKSKYLKKLSKLAIQGKIWCVINVVNLKGDFYSYTHYVEERRLGHKGFVSDLLVENTRMISQH